MGTKTAESFADIFMAEIENKLILKSNSKPELILQINSKPRDWKRHIDDVFYTLDCSEKRLYLKSSGAQPNSQNRPIIFDTNEEN